MGWLKLFVVPAMGLAVSFPRQMGRVKDGTMVFGVLAAAEGEAAMMASDDTGGVRGRGRFRCILGRVEGLEEAGYRRWHT